jgi:protein involved in polysaccharide export with SLBB domain
VTRHPKTLSYACHRGLWRVAFGLAVASSAIGQVFAQDTALQQGAISGGVSFRSDAPAPIFAVNTKGPSFAAALPSLVASQPTAMQPTVAEPVVAQAAPETVPAPSVPAPSIPQSGPTYTLAQTVPLPTLIAQNSLPATAVPGTSPNVAFHSGVPAVQNDSGVEPASGDSGTLGEAQQEMDNLGDKKETLDAELRYANAKLQAAQQRLDVETASGHADEAQKWQQAVDDWNARIKDLQAQSAEVNNEVQGAIQQSQPAEPDNALILPGDNLEVFVVEDPSFNGRYEVRRGGYILMPAVGRISVAGKTLPDAEAEVRRILQTSQLQKATVMVEKVEGESSESGPVIFLAGEFKNPHPFRIPPGTKPTVLNVILSSGGVTDQADLNHVRVMRIVGGKNVVEEENVQRIYDGSGLSSDLTLNDGDVIFVPTGTPNVIFVTGRVQHPGNLPLKPGDKMSAYAAILNCGGFGRFANTKKVYVLRPAPDGTKIRIDINVDAIQHGHAPDLPLQPNDIIVVPEKFFSF